MHNILIIEDNPDIANVVSLNLRDQGHRVSIEHNGLSGLELALAGRFDLIILDLMLPGLDGMEICRQLREKQIQTPILMLTSRSEENDRVEGLEQGADDYLTKPFSIRELMARVKALFRRIEPIDHDANNNQALIQRGTLSINTETREVFIEQRNIDLTAKEFELLLFFAQQPGRVFTRSQLLDKVWGYGHDGYEHTVNSHINRLRSKIETDPSQPVFILTVWGIGYKFAPQPS